MSGQLEIKIIEARLVRIFDSLKPHQDVFVQLACGYDDGSEKVVGRTETHKQGNLNPRWNQTFNCGRDPSRGGRTLKFKVHVDHVWRSPVLCGEAEYTLDMLWQKAGQRPQEVPVPLFKKGEQTGMLSIRIALQGAPQASPCSGGMPVGYEPGAAAVCRTSSGSSRHSGPGGMFGAQGAQDPMLVRQGSGGYHGSVDRPAAAPAYSDNSFPTAGRPLAADSPSLAASVGALSADAPWLQKDHQIREQQQQQQQLREQQQHREQQQREQHLREQQLQQQLQQQQQQQQQMREQQRLPQQQLPQLRYSQGLPEQLSEQRQPQAQMPLHPAEKSVGQSLVPPNRAAPEVRGGSCGWCGKAETSPEAAGQSSLQPPTADAAASSPAAAAGGQSGQWWNSFIDRG
eukprot:TRINITY_DN8346_c0_g1_i3.p1 TRINITY_DN8346_c0_g1~~TRINITY_DN8346_c0_g1_i3.p1  ORF type:complete len:400 (+),score=120.09 TRINITY_DN8346_c0_g1_i3:30-1229(+)